MNHNLVNTKEIASMLGISIASVNYYTNLGLFNIKDKKGNIRLYDKNEILVIHDRISQMKKEGYPLKIIRSKLEKGYSF